MSRKIVYTAGPITAKSDNKRWGYIMAARDLAQKIWAAGHVAICPQMNTLYMDDPCIPPATFYQGDELIIRRCVDAMVMLPGWEQSKGSKQELELAWALKMRIFYHDDLYGLWSFLKAENLAPTKEETL